MPDVPHTHDVGSHLAVLLGLNPVIPIGEWGRGDAFLHPTKKRGYVAELDLRPNPSTLTMMTTGGARFAITITRVD